MIRLAESVDAQALLDIYRYYVENTAITFECEVPSLAEFCQRIENISSRYPYLVWEEEGNIMGYAYAAPFKNRGAAVLHEHCAGKGVGRAGCGGLCG